MCSAVSTWVESVQSAAQSALDEGEGSLEERAEGAVEDVRDATDELEGELRGLEAPEAGEEATGAIDELLDELTRGVETIEARRRERVGGGEGLTSLAAIGTAVASMSDAVSETVDELEGLDTVDTLRDAFEDSDACTSSARSCPERG